MRVNPLDISFEPLAGSTVTNLLRLLAQNHFRIGMIGIPRLLYAFATSLFLGVFNLYDTLRYGEQIKNTVIKRPPIFIIGHWRSGTTYLHNLVTCDPQFAYPTTFQTITPGLFMGSERYIKPIVASSLPPKRPQDDIPLNVDFPQEEEYGMGNLSPYSFYHGWCFPKNKDHYYNFVLMDHVSRSVVDEWKKIYLYYLKKITLYNNGKQLILKNPSNTSRVKLLLEMFPDAKFIHIIRNPYHTYLSMKRNIEKEMTLYCLQKPGEWDTFEASMVTLYISMFKKYYQDKTLIPPGNLVEIYYEEFLTHPFETLKTIYHELGIPGFQDAKNKFSEYITSQGNIKTYQYQITKEVEERIYRHLKMTIDQWGYTPSYREKSTR